MADRERNDLRQQTVATRQVLEAHERRRTLLQQHERPRGMRAAVAALGSGTLWARERPVRLLATAAVVLLGAASSVAPSSVSDEGSQWPSAAASPEAEQDVAAEATVTLKPAGSDGDDGPDADPTGDSGRDPDGAPAEETGQARAADPGRAPSREPDPQSTSGGPAEPSPAGQTDSATSTPSPTPEPSDTGEPDDDPTSEPEPTDSPEPQSPDDDADDGSCLGVNALGLTVDLCVPSLLGS